MPMDLGVASKPVNTEKGIEEVEVEMAEEQEMIDKYYDAALQNLQIKQDIVTQVCKSVANDEKGILNIDYRVDHHI